MAIDSPEETQPDSRISGWRGETLEVIRNLIHAADPAIVEEVKWRKPSNPAGVPVWSRSGIVCTGETYRDKVKLTFPKGAQLNDPSGLFNAGLDGNARRAIDLTEGMQIDPVAFQNVIRAAVALNIAKDEPAGDRAKPLP